MRTRTARRPHSKAILLPAFLSLLATWAAGQQKPPVFKPGGRILVPKEPAQTSVSPPVQSSDQTVVAGEVQINSAQPSLMLSDTSAGKTLAVRNLAGDLLMGSVIRNVTIPGGAVRGDLNLGGAYVDTFAITGAGNVGIGTRIPQHRLSITGGPAWTANGWRGAVDLENGSALAWRANEGQHRFGIGHTNGGFFFFRTSSDPAQKDHPAVYDLTIRDDGTVSVNVIEITGADLAENFEMTDRDDRAVQQGMVVSIDPDHPGKLVVSDRPYDRRVAGVISGAGGIGPGAVMGGNVTSGPDERPVALSGRVYCWADTSGGPIQPGDLLTTSSRRGHARRVTNYSKAQGAILGKAMGSLDQGTGLVLVLVTLQ